MKLNKGVIVKTLIAVLILGVAAFLIYKFKPVYRHDFNAFKNYINSFGKFAVIMYILIFTLRTLLVVFPYSVVVVLGGSIFGPVKGFLYSMIAVFISASMAYYISRLFGKELVQKILRGKFKDMDSKVEEHGFKVILLMRLSTVFPYDIMNFTAGLTKVRYRDFILATLLGIMPETFSLSFLGHNLKNPFSKRFIIAVILIILTVAVPFLIGKYKKKKTEEKINEPFDKE